MPATQAVLDAELGVATGWETAPEWIDRLGLPIKPSTARQWRKRGHGPKCTKFGPGLVMYRTADVNAWAASLDTYGEQAVG